MYRLGMSYTFSKILSNKTDHQHTARMQSEIYLVDMFRPETVVIRTSYNKSKYSTEVKISEPLPWDAGVVTINKNGGA
jgi:hypothetical protein